MLQRVDDRGVLLDVGHWQRDEVHALGDLVGQRLVLGDRLGEHLAALRVVGHRLDRRPGMDEVRVGHHRRDVRREAADHPDRVLQRVPADQTCCFAG